MATSISAGRSVKCIFKTTTRSDAFVVVDSGEGVRDVVERCDRASEQLFPRLSSLKSLDSRFVAH